MWGHKKEQQGLDSGQAGGKENGLNLRKVTHIVDLNEKKISSKILAKDLCDIRFKIQTGVGIRFRVEANGREND